MCSVGNSSRNALHTFICPRAADERFINNVEKKTLRWIHLFLTQMWRKKPHGSLKKSHQIIQTHAFISSIIRLLLSCLVTRYLRVFFFFLPQRDSAPSETNPRRHIFYVATGHMSQIGVVKTAQEIAAKGFSETGTTSAARNITAWRARLHEAWLCSSLRRRLDVVVRRV